jgi:hypothetical protein
MARTTRTPDILQKQNPGGIKNKVIVMKNGNVVFLVIAFLVILGLVLSYTTFHPFGWNKPPVDNSTTSVMVVEEKIVTDSHAGMVNLPKYGWVSQKAADDLNATEEIAEGTPATSWNWKGDTADWNDVWLQTKPIQFDYDSETFKVWIADDGYMRQANQDEIEPSWLAVFGPKTGFDYGTSGSGANGRYISLIKDGSVIVYLGQNINNDGRRNIILSYTRSSDKQTRYVWISKNQNGSLGDWNELNIKDDFTNVIYANSEKTGTADNQKTDTGAVSANENF